MGERRRAQRKSLSNPLSATVSIASPIRLLDMGLGGALLLSKTSVPIGTRGRLQFAVEGVTITADVEVRHVDESAEAQGYRAGVSFIALREDAFAHLRQFLTRSHREV